MIETIDTILFLIIKPDLNALKLRQLSLDSVEQCSVSFRPLLQKLFLFLVQLQVQHFRLLFQELVSDDQLLDFGSAFIDAQGARVAIQTFDYCAAN
jgi:hypothetical protein